MIHNPIADGLSANCGFKEIFNVSNVLYSNNQTISIPLGKSFNLFGDFYIYLRCNTTSTLQTSVTGSIYLGDTLFESVTNRPNETDYVECLYTVVNNFIIRNAPNFNNHSYYISLIENLSSQDLIANELTLRLISSDSRYNINTYCKIFGR